MKDQSKPSLYARTRVFAAAHVPVYAARTVLGGSFEPHSHDFVEIVVIGTGRGMHSTIHGLRPLERGDVYILRPGVWHAYLDCRDLEVFNCCFGLELLQRELSWIREDTRLDYLLNTGPLSAGRQGILSTRMALGVSAASFERLAALYRSFESGNSGSKAGLVGHLLLVLSELAQAVEQLQDVADRKSRPTHEAVAAAIGLMEADLAHEWTLAELAARVHLNASYLVRLFRLHTGLSPMAYLARRKAEFAATLLLRTDYPIARIGNEAGWPDPNYFARRFKSHFGLSATAFRERKHVTGTKPDATHPRDRLR